MTTDREKTVELQIAAAERGPGPAVYQLRTSVGIKGHCQTKKKSPAYSIGSRLKDVTNTNPAPIAVDPSVTRTGRQLAPQFSLKGRPATKAGPEISPGAGHYESHKVQFDRLSTVKAIPKYSLGPRTALPRTDSGPSPNTYCLQRGIGSRLLDKRDVPKWSFYSRKVKGGPHEDLAQTPGPNKYNVINVDISQRNSANFSLGARTKQPNYDSRMQVPGPGSYDPAPGIVNRTGKGFSMGVRHSQYVMPFLTDVDI